MPSVRKSTGRVVTPVRQPEVASAKQAQLELPVIVAFPIRERIEVQPEETPPSIQARLSRPDLMPVDFTSPEEPERIPLEAMLRPPPRSENQIGPMPPPPPLGVRWDQDPSTDDQGTPPGLSLLTQLRPRLAPGLFEPDVAALAFPMPVRQDQEKIVRMLEESADRLLFGDPGAGLEPAMLLGLRELEQAAKIQRVVVVVPEGMLLSWERWFREWSPELSVFRMTDATAIWPETAHVLLTEASRLQKRLEGSPELAKALTADILVLTAYTAFRRRGGDPTALATIPASQRWVVAGGPPPEADDWRVLHRYLHPTWAGAPALAEIQDRLARQTFRLTKESLTGILPRRSRIELWLEMGEEQREAYNEVLEEERTRLEKLGGAVNRSHVLGSLARLKRAMAFRPGTYDGAKVRVLIDLVEEILASDAKIVVVGPTDDDVLSGLTAILEAYGAERLDSRSSDAEQAAIMDRFRREAKRRVLVADTETRGDGEPLQGASYVIHFSHEWNPAHRRRTEQRLFPDLGPSVPQTVFELWMAATVEERYHALLAAQGLLASDIAHETRPKDIEERLTILEWLSTVFEVGSVPTIDRSKDGGTGSLPGTGALREAWASFDPERLASSAESLMHALGFTQVERISEPTAQGCDFLGFHTRAAGAERVFIRCMRADGAVGVDEARRTLEEADAREECVGAYLIATAEFTSSCRRFADQSEDRLALVDGAEFYRHLQVLGLAHDR